MGGLAAVWSHDKHGKQRVASVTTQHQVEEGRKYEWV